MVLERHATKRRQSVASGVRVWYSTGPEARESVAPAVRPGFGLHCDTAPEGRKIRRAGLLRPSGAVPFSYLNPGLTAGATLFRPSGPASSDYLDRLFSPCTIP